MGCLKPLPDCGASTGEAVWLRTGLAEGVISSMVVGRGGWEEARWVAKLDSEHSPIALCEERFNTSPRFSPIDREPGPLLDRRLSCFAIVFVIRSTNDCLFDDEAADERRAGMAELPFFTSSMANSSARW